MADVGVHRPFPLVNRQHVADFLRGVYDGTASGDSRYRHGDIVTTKTGVVRREIEDSTAANIASLAWSGQPWDMPKAFQYYKDRGVPLNRLHTDDEWVMTLAGTLDSTALGKIAAGEEREILWDDEIIRTLTDFQKEAVRQAVQMIRDNGGCFVSDVVGLGKSYIGAAIVKHFERTEQARPLIICPKSL